MLKLGLNEYKGYTVLVTPYNEALKESLLLVPGAIATVFNEFIKESLTIASENIFSDIKDDIGRLQDGQFLIVINEITISTLEDKSLSCILDHEVGHWLNGDLDTKCQGLVVEADLEIAADAYAASIHGKKEVAIAIVKMLQSTYKGMVDKGLLDKETAVKTMSSIVASEIMERRFAALGISDFRSLKPN